MFVQDDIALATDAMNKLQGAVLPSSERGGIRIEYARTKMGDVVNHIRIAWPFRVQRLLQCHIECRLSIGDQHSLHFTYNRMCMKLFKSSNIDLVHSRNVRVIFVVLCLA